MPIVTVTRRLRFNAAHRVHNPALSDEENRTLFGKCMRGINPTAENIVVGCWRVLERRVAPGRLRRLRLWETENNYVEYDGG